MKYFSIFPLSPPFLLKFKPLKASGFYSRDFSARLRTGNFAQLSHTVSDYPQIPLLIYEQLIFEVIFDVGVSSMRSENEGDFFRFLS